MDSLHAKKELTQDPLEEFYILCPNAVNPFIHFKNDIGVNHYWSPVIHTKIMPATQSWQALFLSFLIKLIRR